MKLLLTRALQAILSAEIETLTAADHNHCRGSMPWRRYKFRGLRSRHGLLNLAVPFGYAGAGFARYSKRERLVTTSLRSLVVAGKASTDAAQRFAAQLCDDPLNESALNALTAVLDVEIARFMHRQLEREFPSVEKSRWSTRHALTREP